jgi:parallel beta-helix repeat protein
MRRIVSGMILAFFLVGAFALAFNVGVVQAQAETIYINSDGSVSPSSAPISTVDNVTYTFTGDINDSIVVERNNIVVDGTGHALQGTLQPSSTGIDLSDRNNITIERTGINGFINGILLNHSDNNRIVENTLVNDSYGINLQYSNSNSIETNNINTNMACGIALWYFSNNNTISGNNVENIAHGDGIAVTTSTNNSIYENSIESNYNGIELQFSDNDSISSNNITANSGVGILLWSSSGETMRSNIMIGNAYAFGIHGSSNFLNDVDVSNTIDGRPMCYWIGKRDLQVPSDAGCVCLVDCSNMTVQNLQLARNEQAIVLANTTDSTITQNNLTDNDYGIDLELFSSNNSVIGNSLADNRNGLAVSSSSNNNVSRNEITASNAIGISLDSSNNNRIDENNIADSPNGWGIMLTGSSFNDIISRNSIASNKADGISLWDCSSNNTIFGNNISGNDAFGVSLWDSSSSNKIYENTMTHNYFGIALGSSYNFIYHNNFVNNTYQTYTIPRHPSENYWDDGYPSGGNYWSDYNGTDFFNGPYKNVTGCDGIGDTPYVINANSTDNYPLMGAFSDFNVAQGVDVQVVSNSTVSDFQFNGTATLFNVSGVNGTTGFCNVQVPTALLNGTLTVFVNGTQVKYSLLPSSNSSVSYLYFTYGHSTEQVTILLEFPEPLILAMFMLATLLAISIHKKKHSHP